MRLEPWLPYVEDLAWQRLFAGRLWESGLGGGGLVEFRNKGFRKLVSPSELAEGERGFFPLALLEWGQQPGQNALGAHWRELARALEAQALESAHVQFVSAPVRSITPLAVGARVGLGSGEQFEAPAVVYADRWFGAQGLQSLSGVPRGLRFLRGRTPMSVLQVEWQHAPEWLGAGQVSLGEDSGLAHAAIGSSFVVPLPREAGEEVQRHGWGYFVRPGAAGGLWQSVWSVALDATESDDNAQISSRLRRLKRGLSKAFPGLVESTRSERLSFAEAALLSSGRPADLKGAGLSTLGAGVWCLTDGYGPSLAFEQALGVVAALDPGFDSFLGSQAQTHAHPVDGWSTVAPTPLR